MRRRYSLYLVLPCLFQLKISLFAAFSFLNVRICRIPLSYMTVMKSLEGVLIVGWKKRQFLKKV